ncbi:MAG: rhomboid family intramembrane serine protease [Steroidobacteraceae bacterium]|nr:rhomboid family intramembrane serine protease [Steroidobacteraceae bacterium]MDW8258623.1 rhomboid family intramembrane serine protease [Gammaproteobacteria bacterium]
MPPITRTLVYANLAVFAAQLLSADRLLPDFALWPVGSFDEPSLGRRVGFEPWQLVTSAFLHGGVAHLLLNMFALYMFGSDVERALGARRYAVLYIAAVLTAGIVQLAVVSGMAGDGRPVPTVGASGGVFGVLLAFGMLFPRRRVLLLIPPIPMPAWLLVFGYGILELINGVFGTMSGVAHFAHLGGMLGAFVVLYRWRRFFHTRY